MRIRLPATRSPLRVDARRRGFAMIASHRRRNTNRRIVRHRILARSLILRGWQHRTRPDPSSRRELGSRAPGSPPPGQASARRERQRPEATGIAAELPGASASGNWSGEPGPPGVAKIPKAPDRHQPRKLQAGNRQPGLPNAGPAANEKIEPVGQQPRHGDQENVNRFRMESRENADRGTRRSITDASSMSGREAPAARRAALTPPKAASAGSMGAKRPCAGRFRGRGA